VLYQLSYQGTFLKVTLINLS